MRKEGKLVNVRLFNSSSAKQPIKFGEQANEDVMNSPLNPFFSFWDDLICFAKVLLQLLAYLQVMKSI